MECRSILIFLEEAVQKCPAVNGGWNPSDHRDGIWWDLTATVFEVGGGFIFSFGLRLVL
jgi:hypothetical protein